MSDTLKTQDPVAIKIEGGSNIRLDNNVSVGMPLLDAKNVKNLSGAGNVTIGSRSPVTAKKRWFEKPVGITVLGVLASLVAWAVLHYYGLS